MKYFLHYKHLIQKSLIVFAVSPLFLHASTIPFEKCTYVRKGFTERMVAESFYKPAPISSLKKTTMANSDDMIFRFNTTQACESCILKANPDSSFKLFRAFMSSFGRKKPEDTPSVYQEISTRKIINSEENQETIADAATDADSKNSIHPVCFYASSLKSQNRNGGRNRNSYYYCDSVESREPRSYYEAEKPNGETGIFKPRRPCLSRNYVAMTAESFNYMAGCFDFKDLEDKVQLFSLFNHESSFILNTRSPTGARCYGQITSPVIKEIDDGIYGKSKKHKAIYAAALKNCPDLDQRVIPPQKNAKNPPYTCRTTQNPDTCFFYSMFNIKINEQTLQRSYKTIRRDLPKGSKISESTKKAFHLPISIQEVVQVKGTIVQKNGTTKKVDLILKDGRAVHNFLKNTNYKKSKLDIVKLNLYGKNKKLKWYILHSAYNGGISVISNHLEIFAQRIKDQVYRSCGEMYSKKYCEYKKQLQKRRSLSYTDITKDFRNYLLTNYTKKPNSTRNKEVANFYNKIKSDQEIIGSIPPDYNSPATHLQFLIATNNSIFKESEKVRDVKQKKEDLSKSIQQHCQNIIGDNFQVED